MSLCYWCGCITKKKRKKSYRFHPITGTFWLCKSVSILSPYSLFLISFPSQIDNDQIAHHMTHIIHIRVDTLSIHKSNNSIVVKHTLKWLYTYKLYTLVQSTYLLDVINVSRFISIQFWCVRNLYTNSNLTVLNCIMYNIIY